MSSIKAKLVESNPERVEVFTNEIPAVVKKIVANIKNYQVTT